MDKTNSVLHVVPRPSGMRRWATTVCWLLSAAILALASCAVATGSAFANGIPTGCSLAPRSGVGPESESAAQADAASLLAELPLPPGSSESSTEPAEDDSLLAHPGIGPPATPNAVDEHAWWLVPVAPAEALVYICAHLPTGTARTGFGRGPSGPNVPENEIAAFAVPGSPGTLVIWAVRLPNGSTALRADAQVVWITPRPASETIPSGAHLLRIAAHSRNSRHRRSSRYSESGLLSLLERLPWKVTSAGQIEEIVALLNKLRVDQPGLRHCPLSVGDSSVDLTFYASPGTAPLAVADIEPVGCPGSVSLTIGGISQPRLEGGWSLVEQIGEALGVNAAAGPPIGAKPRISRVRMSRKRFMAEQDGEEQGNVVSPVAPGSEFIFELSAPAEVRIAISRLPPGTSFADTCVANAQRARRRRTGRCQRTAVVARLTRLTEPEGEDGIEFSGREDHRALEPGHYIAVLRARNTSGRSRVASVQFEITR